MLILVYKRFKSSLIPILTSTDKGSILKTRWIPDSFLHKRSLQKQNFVFQQFDILRIEPDLVHLKCTRGSAIQVSNRLRKICASSNFTAAGGNETGLALKHQKHG